MSLMFAVMLSMASAASPADPALRLRLLALAERDQMAAMLKPPERAARFRANLRALRKLLGKSDWPTISRVGEDGAHAAWLVAQHATFDLQFQRETLRKLRILEARGEAHPDNIAYLEDAVALGEGRSQRFGTQGRCVGGQWRTYAIADALDVDARRSAAGLEPLAAATARASRALCEGGQ